MPRSFFAFASLALAACTGDVCSQEQAQLQEAAQINLSCLNAELEDAGLPPWDGGIPTCSINVAACESGLKSCTAADIQIFQTTLNCENQILAQERQMCAVPTSFECPSDAGAGTISPACAQAFANDVRLTCDGGLP